MKGTPPSSNKTPSETYSILTDCIGLYSTSLNKKKAFYRNISSKFSQDWPEPIKPCITRDVTGSVRKQINMVQIAFPVCNHLRTEPIVYKLKIFIFFC